MPLCIFFSGANFNGDYIHNKNKFVFIVFHMIKCNVEKNNGNWNSIFFLSSHFFICFCPRHASYLRQKSLAQIAVFLSRISVAFRLLTHILQFVFCCVSFPWKSISSILISVECKGPYRMPQHSLTNQIVDYDFHISEWYAETVKA